MAITFLTGMLILIDKMVIKNHYVMSIVTTNGFLKHFSHSSVITIWVFSNESP